jgi:DUF4097 and DUF4098 domain-containing protein YvlB
MFNLCKLLSLFVLIRKSNKESRLTDKSLAQDEKKDIFVKNLSQIKTARCFVTRKGHSRIHFKRRTAIMSWLISLVIAGAMFASDGNLPVSANYNPAESKFAHAKTSQADEIERFEQTYALSANGRVTVSNVNGSIAVDVWDRNEVKLAYVKTADTKENLAEVEVKIDARADLFSVETNFDQWKRSDGKRNKNSRFEIEYRLTVPRNAILNEIETVNGSVSIIGAGNLTKASSVNGQVRATNLRGTADLSTVNGTVDADFDQLQADSKISLSTVNGAVNLLIPSDANATVKADTLNGQISNDFGLPVRKGEYVGRDLRGKIGSGNVRIQLSSVNGGLSIRRKNDGKSINKVTDLLTTRSEDNWDDEDFDNDSDAKAPKPPKPPSPPKPSRKNGGMSNQETNKLIAQSIRDAQKEIKNIEPELAKIQTEGFKQVLKINSEELHEQLKEAQEKYKEAFAQMPNVNWTFGAPSIEEKRDSFVVKGTPKVTVDAKNYDVRVRGWDKSEVSYSIVRISRNNLKKPLDTNSSTSIKAEDSEVSIKISSETTSPGGIDFDDATKMRIEVFVPKKSNLKVITNREIRVEGVSGTLDLRGADESINVRDGDGLLTVSGRDARIRVIGFRGELESRTIGGSMFLEGGLQRLLAESSSGEIVLSLPENENALIGSNKKVNFEGTTMTQHGEKTWRVGNSGGSRANYFLQSANGEIFVRSSDIIKSNEE